MINRSWKKEINRCFAQSRWHFVIVVKMSKTYTNTVPFFIIANRYDIFFELHFVVLLAVVLNND